MLKCIHCSIIVDESECEFRADTSDPYYVYQHICTGWRTPIAWTVIPIDKEDSQMISKDDLEAMRERAAIQTLEPLPTALAKDVNRLIDELDRVRKIHTEEQGRSADRLREALNK